MLAIVISVCLVSDPTICRNERIPLNVNVSPNRCAMGAQPYVAKWTGEHPDWRVVRWRCSSADERDI